MDSAREDERKREEKRREERKRRKTTRKEGDGRLGEQAERRRKGEDERNVSD